MTIETTKVTLKGDVYLITDIEEINVTVDQELARDVALRTELDEESIAVILATIEKNRILSSSSGRIYRKIKEGDLLYAIPRLLTRYTEQALCDAMEDLKYFQICEVMEGSDPVAELRKYDYNQQEYDEEEND